MKRFHFIISLAFLLLVSIGGGTFADSPANTTANVSAAGTTPATTAASDRIGGSIFFDTHPTGATVWLDNVAIGTSAFTYYSEKTGTFDVIVRKKGYEEYTDKITVSEGKRVVVDVLLKPVSTIPENTPTVPVVTATTIRKSTLMIPTPWPTTTEAPVDPAVVIGAVAVGGVLVATRRQ